MEARRDAALILYEAGWLKSRIALAFGLKLFQPSMFPCVPLDKTHTTQRNEEIKELFVSGVTMDQIALQFGITRARVQQVLKRYGLTANDGGRSVGMKDRQKAREDAINEALRVKRDRRAMEFYGCTHAEARAINGGLQFSAHGSRARAYMQQRKSAIARNVGWEITFAEWCQIWDESGKWEQRGRGKGDYCMARYGDSGPYKIGNIYIASCVENISDSYKFKPVSERYGRSKRDQDGFTPKERIVVDLFSAGLNTDAIAAQLGCQRQTVYQHLCHIRARNPSVLEEAVRAA